MLSPTRERVPVQTRRPRAWGMYAILIALYVRKHGPCTIKQVADALGLSGNSAYVVAKRMSADGILAPDGLAPAASGPAPVVWTLAPGLDPHWVRDMSFRYRAPLQARGFGDLLEDKP